MARSRSARCNLWVLSRLMRDRSVLSRSVLSTLSALLVPLPFLLYFQKARFHQLVR